MHAPPPFPQSASVLPTLPCAPSQHDGHTWTPGLAAGWPLQGPEPPLQPPGTMPPAAPPRMGHHRRFLRTQHHRPATRFSTHPKGGGGGTTSLTLPCRHCTHVCQGSSPKTTGVCPMGQLHNRLARSLRWQRPHSKTRTSGGVVLPRQARRSAQLLQECGRLCVRRGHQADSQKQSGTIHRVVDTPGCAQCGLHTTPDVVGEGRVRVADTCCCAIVCACGACCARQEAPM